MDRLGQSLDDIIASRPKQDRGNKKGGRGGGRGGSKQGTKVVFRSEKKVGKVKATSQTVIRQPFVKKQITERVGKVSTGSIFDRLGTGAPAPKSNIVSGTQVLFANLRPDIVSGDIAELCGTVGEVKQVDIILNKSGRSTGVAEVYFARRSDANTAVKKFHGLTLDGAPMKVTLAGQNGKANPFNPLPLEEETNKRAGFFGTALDDDDDDDEPPQQFRQESGRRRASEGLGGAGSWKGKGRGGRVVLSHEGHDDRGIRTGGAGAGGERRGGKGRGGRDQSRGGRGAARKERESREPVTQDALDDDMDSYMAAR